VSVISFLHYLYLLISALTGNYEVVQGQVEQFSPMPYEGHADESFVVKGKKFEYSDYSGVTGFHNTSSHGGPIRQGLQVRISYVDDTIIKLEVKK
jgi:hypothetical protein